MQPRCVRYKAPASIANLGLLFDVAGLAVDYAYDVVEACLLSEGELRIDVEVEGADLPRGQGNVAYAAAEEFMQEVETPAHVRILVRKGVPIGSGLGSSGATAAATVAALNDLLGDVASREDLVRVAGRAERVAAGAPHYDNVGASLLGGLVLVLDPDHARVARLEWPSDASIVVFRPLRSVVETGGKPKTAAMREVLPREVPLARVVDVTRRALDLLLALSSGEWRRALSHVNYGWEVEEARSKLIPGYREAKEAAFKAGAVAFNISGAGPTLFAVTAVDDAEAVREAVARVLEAYWGGLDARVVTVDREGARPTE